MRLIPLYSRLWPIAIVGTLYTLSARGEDTVIPPPALDDAKNQAQACFDLIQTIRHSDCGNLVYRWLDGGFVSLGLSWYSLAMKATKDKRVYADFLGETFATPHYGVTTRPNYFKESAFGYEYSLGITQAYTTVQGIDTAGKRVAHDLGTYVVASLYAVQANLFYAVGAHDESPHRYFRFGMGIGAGYANIKGKMYLTERQATDNPACALAVTELGAGDSSAAARLRQNCPYEDFNRWGLGFSARLLLEGRINAWLFTVQTNVVNLPSKASIVAGKGKYDFDPTATYATIAYLFDL